MTPEMMWRKCIRYKNKTDSVNGRPNQGTGPLWCRTVTQSSYDKHDIASKPTDTGDDFTHFCKKKSVY